MDTRKTKDIKVVSNPRTDFGNLEELKQSILAHGIIEPLVINKKNELIAGERRLRAAIELEMDAVPVVIMEFDKASIPAVKLIENIHRKDLTPFEEAHAFKQYMTDQKIDAMGVAGMIGKTEGYVNRRLNLLSLCSESSNALSKGKIQFGHCEYLSQMTPAQQKACVKLIVDNDLTVQGLADQLRWNQNLEFFHEFRSAPNDEESQTVLTSIGTELDAQHETNSSHFGAFKPELSKYVEEQRAALRKQGITVYASQETLLKAHPNAATIYSYNDEYQKAIGELRNSDKYAVVVDLLGSGYLKKEVYRLSKVEAPKKEKEQKTKTVLTAAQQAAEEKALNLNRKEKLERRVAEYKRDWLIEQISSKPFNPGSKVLNRLCLHALIEKYPGDKEELKTLLTSVGIKNFSYGLPDYSFNDLQRLSNTQADALLMGLSKAWVPMLSGDSLEECGVAAGVKPEKDYRVTEEFLEFHTKEQLLKLGKELGVSEKNDEQFSKSELVKLIAKSKPKTCPGVFVKTSAV